MGTLDLYQFLVTAADSTKFMIWAGTPSVDNAYRMADIQPDLAAVYISPKQDFLVHARIVNAMNPNVLMPHHYDIWPTILKTRPEEVQQFPSEVQPVTPENVIEKIMRYASNKLAESKVRAQYFVLEHHAWYYYDRTRKQVEPGKSIPEDQAAK